MNKNKIKEKFEKVKNRIWIIPTALLMLKTKVFAQGSIGTAEVEQATEKVKSTVIKLAMPIRWDISICKYCNNSIKNDSKF